mgnify:CR=1 FL=1
MYVIVIDEQKCTVCGECVKICPVEIYKLVDGRILVHSRPNPPGTRVEPAAIESQV